MQHQLSTTPIANHVHTADIDIPRRSRCKLGFGLFLLLNGVLFIRPGEVVPALVGLPIYEVVIVGCLLASLPAIAERLRWSELSKNLAVVCTLGMLPAVVLSFLTHGNLYDARMSAIEFGKVILYYLLLIGLIDSWWRFRIFLLFILGYITATAVLALLSYHGAINIAALTPYMYPTGDAESGDGGMLVRLQASGIFGDPNDFSLILVSGLLLCTHLLIESNRLLRRACWFLPVPVLGYAFFLTRSRGGLLALLAGLLTLTLTRFGWRKTLPIWAVLLPTLLIVFGGRQTSIDLSDTSDTAQGRIQIWRDCLVLLHHDPLRGLGYGMLFEETGRPAHNSFVHCFCELGLIGGTLFTGAFYVSISAIGNLRPRGASRHSSEGAYWRQPTLAVAVAYAIGLCSLSRPYGVPTYLILGLCATYLGLAQASRTASILNVRGSSLGRVAIAGAACLLFFEVFVRVFAV